MRDGLVDAARDVGVGCLVHISTESVLIGGPTLRRADETWPRPARPLGLYALTKGLAEDRVLAANSPSLRTVIVRPRFVWGPGDTALLPKIARTVREGKYIWVDGGRYLTSTCHVRNLCEGLLLAADRGRGGEIYFLTDGEPVEVRTFLTRLLRAEGLDPGNRSLPFGVAYTGARVMEGIWRLFRLGGGRFADALESGVRFAAIDWQSTRAFSEEPKSMLRVYTLGAGVSGRLPGPARAA